MGANHTLSKFTCNCHAQYRQVMEAQCIDWYVKMKWGFHVQLLGVALLLVRFGPIPFQAATAEPIGMLGLGCIDYMQETCNPSDDVISNVSSQPILTSPGVTMATGSTHSTWSRSSLCRSYDCFAFNPLKLSFRLAQILSLSQLTLTNFCDDKSQLTREQGFNKMTNIVQGGNCRV